VLTTASYDLPYSAAAGTKAVAVLDQTAKSPQQQHWLRAGCECWETRRHTDVQWLLPTGIIHREFA